MLRIRMTAAVLLSAGLAAFAQTPPPATPPKEAPKEAPKTAPAEPPKTTPPATPPMTPPATPPATAPMMPPATTPATAPVPPAADKQQFPLKFEKSKPFYEKLSTNVTQTIKVPGSAELNQKHEQTFFFKWNPLDQVGDKWTVKETIEGAKMTIDIAGNQVKYDSTAAADTAGGAQPSLADFFGKLVGSEFTVTFGKGMAVEKVDGRDDFLKKLGGVNNQMESILKKMLSDDSLKQMVDPSFGLNPPSEQPVGGSWEKTTTMSLGPIGSYELKTKYTYKGKDAKDPELDRIEVSTSVTYKAPTEQADGLLFKIKGGELKSLDPTPDMAANNFILYSPKAGRIVKSSMQVKMKGTLNLTIGGTDTTIELNQDQTTTVEMRDTTFVEPKKP